MRKIMWVLVLTLLLAGCELGTDMTNNPTSKVEGYLDGYKRLDQSVLTDLDRMIENNKYTIEQRTSYKELMKKHYRDLTYEIKDETVNGNRATVEVEIEVTDYNKALSEDANPNDYLDDEGNYSESKHYDYQLNLMKDSSDRVKYTIIFYLTKEKDEWTLDELSETTKEKIHGIYKY